MNNLTENNVGDDFYNLYGRNKNQETKQKRKKRVTKKNA